MQADKRFRYLPKEFWANIRTISEELGYTSRRGKDKGQVKTPTLAEMRKALEARSLKSFHLGETDSPTEFGQTLLEYYRYRADILNDYVAPRLMEVDRAREIFETLHKRYNPQCPQTTGRQESSCLFYRHYQYDYRSKYWKISL